jgi:hypothetical protein
VCGSTDRKKVQVLEFKPQYLRKREELMKILNLSALWFLTLKGNLSYNDNINNTHWHASQQKLIPATHGIQPFNQKKDNKD